MVPIPYTKANSFRHEPFALRIAMDDNQSNTPCSRANSESNIIPIRNRQTSSAFTRAFSASFRVISRRPSSSTTPALTQYTSGTFRGRISIKPMLTKTTRQMARGSKAAGIKAEHPPGSPEKGGRESAAFFGQSFLCPFSKLFRLGIAHAPCDVGISALINANHLARDNFSAAQWHKLASKVRGRTFAYDRVHFIQR